MLLVAGMLAASAPYAVSANAEHSAPQAAQQADGTCTGTVIDSTGEPLMGVTVRVEGTSIAGATNLDGEFSLRGVKKGAKITFNYIGMKPKTLTWDGTPINLTMEDDSNVLDEVVVMGYGVAQKRSKVTNSIAKVSKETLTVGANSNPAQALAGAVSGVKVTVNSGDPSATPAITVRGGTNWDGNNNNPLVVVDGQIRSSLADINPNDIESMEILKDAGATALYGARAANGVVLITTKSGKEGTGRVTLSAKYGVTNYTNGYDWADAATYLQYSRTATYNTANPDAEGTWLHNFFGNLNNGSQPYSLGNTKLSKTSLWNILTLTDENKYLLDYGWQTMPDPLNGVLGTNNTILFKDPDVLDYVKQHNTATQDYNLTFSGGNDRGNYYASLGYYKSDGALPDTFYERYNFSFTGGYKIAKWLQANSVFNFTRANWNNEAGAMTTALVFGRIASFPATARFQDEEGNETYQLQLSGTSANLHYQPEKFIRENESDKFQMTQSLTATIIPGLTLKGTMSWFYHHEMYQSFNKDFQSNINGSMNKERSTSARAFRYFDQTYNLVANFNRTFNEKHTVNAMAGVEYYKRQYKNLQGSGSKAVTDDFGNLQYTFNGTQSPYAGSTRSMATNYANEAILSYFARAEYDYDDKYLIAATLRQDGYSRLQDNRWGTFPGVSAGWVFSKENFWANNEALNFINYAKLRASYGLNGIVNGNVIGYYTLLGAYSAYQYGGNQGYRLSTLPNLGLRWERTRTFDVGLTFGFLQNRFNLDIAYYNRLTMDKYASKALPATTGWTSITTNNGSFRNQGVEIDINATLLRTRDFSWTLGANLTYNKNIVVDLPYLEGVANNRQGGTEVYTGNGNETTFIGGLQEGQEPMHMIGYKNAGILRSEADVAALGDYIDVSRSALSSVAIYANPEGLERLRREYPNLVGTAVKLQPGDAVWRDRNGDNMIDQFDQYDLGNRLPHWTGGFNTTVSWKGLSLYARFDMGFDFTVYDGALSWWMGGGQGTYSYPTQIKDTWTPENPNAKYPRYVIASNMGTNSWSRVNDICGQSGAYLACRELSLSYQLPQSICEKFRSQGLTLSVTGQNLGYIKKTTLPLPDATAVVGGTSDRAGTYNLPRTFLFGLNVSF